MKEVAKLLNAMREAGVIADYALFGAAAQMRYTEAVATFDADVLVAVPSSDRLDVLRPLYELFATQAAWQRGRTRLSWPDKIRMAELMREAAETLRGERASVLRRDLRDLHPQPSRPPAPPFA